MNNPIKRPLLVLMLVLALMGVTGFVWWRLSVRRHVGHYAILVDPSDSQALDSTCDKAKAVARQALDDPRMARGGKVALFGMGASTTANEPELKGIATVPDTSAVMGGESAVNAKRLEFENQIVGLCKQVAPTIVSPVFGSLKRVVEFLQQQDSDPDAYLVMHAITDGEETEVKEIIKAFREKPGSRVNLSMVIDNRRVRTEICGVAETIGTIAVGKNAQLSKTPPRTPERGARLTEVWREAFTERVQVKPYCLSTLPQTASR